MDYKQERQNEVDKILRSNHPRKVVVAGPGTGKSFLFEQAIKKELASGKKRFLAITFIGKLGEALADDLAGLAETTTLHRFARKFVLDNCPLDGNTTRRLQTLFGKIFWQKRLNLSKLETTTTRKGRSTTGL
jgi:hypothetical protein